MITYIVDSFTNKPFSGNPAGVCLVEDPLRGNDMLLIAKELGLSETAFIQRTKSDECWSIRFFSPVMEIPLCGHATLASAAVLFNTLELSEVTFTNVNALRLPVRKLPHGITMQFPVHTTQPATVSLELLAALGISSVENSVYNEETKILMLEIGSTKKLAKLKPDFHALIAANDSINGVLVTALSPDDDFDFHSRYFWPWSGTNEDPATGGTHTFLAPYWGAKLNKTELRSYQASERSGFMDVRIEKDKIFITSQAQIVLRGKIEVPQ